MGRSPHINVDKRQVILSLAKDTVSSREIVSKLMADDSTVCWIVKQHEKTGSVELKPCSGWPRKSSEHQDRHLKLLRMANRFKIS